MKRLPPIRPPVRRYPDAVLDEALRVQGWGRAAWLRLSGMGGRWANVGRRGAVDDEADEPATGPWRNSSRWPWLLAIALFVFPLVVYWPTITQTYGFRDDYSILRESHDEPTKVFQVCAMQARPLYGGFLETSFRMVPGIAELQWVRAYAALMIGAVCAVVFLILRALRWDTWTAAVIGAFVAVLPSVQVMVSWAVAWPLALSLLLAIAAFAAAEHGFTLLDRRAELESSARRGLRGVAWWGTGVFLLTSSALVYQSNALFYFTAIAAALWSRRNSSRLSVSEWLVRHGVTVVIGLGTAFTLTMVAFAQGWVPVSRRVAFDHDWIGKVGWFVHGPLQNALGLIALNENGGSPRVPLLAAVSGAVLLLGVLRVGQTQGWRAGAWWAGAFLVLPFASFAVNLAVADRWPAYRVLLPLTATVTILLAISLLNIGGRWLARCSFLGLLVAGIWLARTQTFDGFAYPQKVELDLLRAGAERIDPAAHPRVFVITPGADDHVSRAVYLDEFGSFSTDSSWTPKEMVKLLVRERFPGRPNVANEYTFDCGPRPPRDGSFDVVIDMRRLREFRPN